MTSRTDMDRLLEQVEKLDDEAFEAFLREVNLMIARRPRCRPYDPAKDPILNGGLFDGSPDLAERSSDILRAEFGIMNSHDQRDH